MKIVERTEAESEKDPEYLRRRIRVTQATARRHIEEKEKHHQLALKAEQEVRRLKELLFWMTPHDPR